MAAASATTSLSLSLDAILAQAQNRRFSSCSSSTPGKLTLPSPPLSKATPYTLLCHRPWTPHILSPVPCTASTPSSTQSIPAESAQAPPATTAFLDASAANGVRVLADFRRVHDFPHGSLEIRVMAIDEVDATTELLAESYAESLRVPMGYSRLLAMLIKQHVLDKQAVLPYAATLVGFYKATSDADGDEEEEAVLAGTAEIFFDARGANSSPPPTPTPPRDCPYICNMAVTKTLRRKGIGWHLLKACEELIGLMTQSDIVYLHCQMVDKGPLNMYTKAGYRVCNTDNILTWLTLQRRKYLMCKELDLQDVFSS